VWLLVVIAELGVFSSRGRPGTIWRKPGRGIAAAVAIWTTILLAGPVSSPVDLQHLLPRLVTEAREPASSTINRRARMLQYRPRACPTVPLFARVKILRRKKRLSGIDAILDRQFAPLGGTNISGLRADLH
jgi:hypothetical protein